MVQVIVSLYHNLTTLLPFFLSRRACCILLYGLSVFYNQASLASAIEQRSISNQLKAIVSSSSADEEKVLSLLSTTKGDDLIFVKLKLIDIYRDSGKNIMAKSLLDNLLNDLHFYGKEIKIKVLMSLAQFERSQNNYAKAANILEKQTLKLAKPDSPQLGKIYQLTGVSFRQQMKLKQAKVYYLLALEHFRQNNNKDGEAKIYSNLGVLYESSGDLVLAAEYQKKAMRHFEKTNDINGLATNYFNLGELYFRSKDLEKSLIFYFKALEYDQKLNNIQDIGYDYHRIGTIYLQQNDLIKALEYTHNAIKIFVNISAAQLQSRSYIQLAEIYTSMNDQPNRFSSLNSAEKAINLAPTQHQHRELWHGYSQYYLAEGEYNLANDYAKKAFEISAELGLLVHHLSDNELLSVINKNLGNFDIAYHYLIAAFELKKKLNSEQKIKEIEKHKRDIHLLEEQIKVEKLEKNRVKIEEEIIVHKAVNQRNIFIFVSLIVLFFVGFYLLHQRRKVAELKASLYEDALTQRNQFLADVSHELRTPLTALKLQIDALKYNLVDNIDLSYQKLSIKVMDLNRLIGDIYELATSDKEGISFDCLPCDIIPLLNKWNSEFEHYVSAEGFEWRFCMHVTTAKVKIDIMRIKQVISNLISNSIKYTDKPGTIQLSANIKQECLILIVKDTSPSVPENETKIIFERLYRVEKSRNRQTGGSGLGLSISQNIIKAHQGIIFAKKSNIGGVAIIMKIPLFKE
jgi:signal transduction histidine kinase/TPR repeat protein